MELLIKNNVYLLIPPRYPLKPVAIFIHSYRDKWRERMNENRDVTSFLVSRLNQA